MSDDAKEELLDGLVPISASRALRELLGRLQIGVAHPTGGGATWLVPPWAWEIWLCLSAEDEERGLRIARDSEGHRAVMLVIGDHAQPAARLKIYLDAIDSSEKPKDPIEPSPEPLGQTP